MPNSLPDGSKYIHPAGYEMLKYNGVWRLKHILLWEQAHGQSVPEGHYIIFGDSNKQNFNINNLFCVTVSQNAIRIRKELRGETPELAAAGVALAKLYSTINEKKKSGAGGSESSDVNRKNSVIESSASSYYSAQVQPLR